MLSSRLRAPAWICCAALLWCLGVELGPNLHIGLHAELAAHVHGRAASREDGDHDNERAHHEHAHHEHARHDHVDHEAAPRELAPSRGVQPLDPDHGRHHPLHRGLAVMVVAAPNPVPVCAVHERLAAPSSVSKPAHECALRDLRARGPPGRVVAFRLELARTA